MPLRGTVGDLSRDSDGGFSNKTMEREWNTSEEQLRKGKSFRVRYVGRVSIVISMRTLEFSDRALVAKECITRVCEATGITASSRKRKTDKRIQQVLGTVDLTNANSDVDLFVSVDSLKVGKFLGIIHGNLFRFSFLHQTREMLIVDSSSRSSVT